MQYDNHQLQLRLSGKLVYKKISFALLMRVEQACSKTIPELVAALQGSGQVTKYLLNIYAALELDDITLRDAKANLPQIMRALQANCVAVSDASDRLLQLSHFYLGLGPGEFWQLSPKEFCALSACLPRDAGAPVLKQELSEMMQKFPDLSPST